MTPPLDDRRLDSDAEIAATDPRGMLRALATAGAQVRETMTLAQEAGIESISGGERPRSVLVASLGGSAVVGDILEVLAEPSSPVPVTVRSNVPLPGWVGPLDLVIAVSLSGKAVGPLALAAEAARRGAALLTVSAPDSPLAEVCARARGINIDPGRGRTNSRTSLWSMLTPVLLGAGSLGLVDVDERVLLAAADRLDEQADACRPSSESFVNPAKLIAADLAEGVPVVLGDGPVCGVAARRAVAMIARTGRMPATWGELPDDASSVVSCFDGPFAAAALGPGARRDPDDIFADPFLDGPPAPRLSLLVLRDALPDPVTQQAAAAHNLAETILDSARETGVRVSEATAGPGHPLVRLAGHLALVDHAATYLAVGHGLDPATSPHVAGLRDRTRG